MLSLWEFLNFGFFWNPLLHFDGQHRPWGGGGGREGSENQVGTTNALPQKKSHAMAQQMGHPNREVGCIFNDLFEDFHQIIFCMHFVCYNIF